MKRKLNNSCESSNHCKMQIDFYNLSRKGLHLRYYIGGIKHKLFLDPLQTLDAFDNLNLISGYQVFAGEPEIITEYLTAYPGYDGEPVEYTDTREESWLEFVKRFAVEEMTDSAAAIISQYLHDRKEAEAWANEIRSIPTLIRSIA